MKYVPGVFLGLKCGKEVVLLDVLFVNVPGSSVSPTVNCLALLIPVTANVLLNIDLATPAVLLVLVILRISTVDPDFKLCGISVTIVATFPVQVASAIYLGFLSSVELSRVTLLGLYKYPTSPSVEPIEALDSCITNPSIGGRASNEEADGRTYLARYMVSSKLLVSDFLLMNDLAVASPSEVEPKPTILV